jgi:hypothetical protein
VFEVERPHSGRDLIGETSDGLLNVSNDRFSREMGAALDGKSCRHAALESRLRQLVAGQRYYIETLHSENDHVGDHVQVAWTGPGIANPTIIPANALEPYDCNTPPIFATGHYSFSVDASQPTGTVIGTVSASDSDPEALAFAITSGNEGGAFAINPSGQISLISTEWLFNGVRELTVTAQDGGIGALYPFRSATATVLVEVIHAADLVLPVPDPMGWAARPRREGIVGGAWRGRCRGVHEP